MYVPLWQKFQVMCSQSHFWMPEQGTRNLPYRTGVTHTSHLFY
jgi:hypothetical protein